jgi:amidase
MAKNNRGLQSRKGDEAEYEIAYASAWEIARAIRSREISSVEVTEALLKRVDQVNSTINAICVDLREQALSRAQLADEALARGEWWGAFHGVPCTVKDTFEIAGLPTTAGDPTLRDRVSSVSSPVVDRLQKAGAVIIGKTNTSMLGRDWQTYNPVFGVTNNPWDVTRTPGGSSGGSAAAVAAGLTYLCVGSDLGGSIRIPASFCGVYGHKPSFNLVPTSGHIPPYPGKTLSPLNPGVRGPLARSAADLKMALSVLGGPDAENGAGYYWSLPAGRGARLSDYRIGFVLQDSLCPVSTEAADVIATAVDALGHAGAKLQEGWPSDLLPKHQHEVYGEKLAALDSPPAGGSKDGWRTIKKQLFFDIEARATARRIWSEYFRTHDLFLLPSVFLTAFPHDHTHPMDSRRLETPEGPRPYIQLPFWGSFATIAGLPATVAPAGLTRQGLPVGIQILGPYLEDTTTIELAGKLADIIGGYHVPKSLQ